MKSQTLKTGAICLAIVAAALISNRIGIVQGQMKKTPGEGFAAVPGLKGGQDPFGPYDPVPGWPKPLEESMPDADHKGWTWSQATNITVAGPNRFIILQKGELPVIPKNVPTTWLPQLGPGLRYPPGIGVPLREAASATPSCGGRPYPTGVTPNPNCPVAGPDGRYGRPGVDWRWEHVITVVDANGNTIEDWRQYDSIWGRPHDAAISPYDPEKNIWLVDADNHFVTKMTNDGKKRLMTLGTPGVPGTDDTHFARPTFIAFMDKNTMYLADGYDGTRVIKYDMSGKKLMQWGQKGNEPNEMRPGYFNSVHGIAVDPTTRRVYINDRNNGRLQVFDENGKFLDQWSFGPRPPMNIHQIWMGQDHKLWAADQGGNKMLQYDAGGHFLYAWGTQGTCSGCIWGVHGFTTDADGNLYTAEVRSGRVQKFTPRKGANPDFLIGKPWK